MKQNFYSLLLGSGPQSLTYTALLILKLNHRVSVLQHIAANMNEKRQLFQPHVHSPSFQRMLLW